MFAALLLLLTPSAQAITTPADVKKLEAKIKTCNRLAENPPTDEKKVLALEERMKKAGCEDIEAEEKKLRWKYRNQLKVLDLIEKATAEETEEE